MSDMEDIPDSNVAMNVESLDVDDGWGKQDDGDDWGNDDWGDDNGNGGDDMNGNDNWGNDWDDPNEIKEIVPLKRAKSYCVMEKGNLDDRCSKLIKRTSELLYVTETEASCLLRNYGWEFKKLQEKWFLDSEKVRTEVGLTEDKKEPIEHKSSTKAKKMYQCNSAFCDVVSEKEGMALNCGHFFCNDCWEGFLLSQINNGRTCIFSSCMGMKCKKDHLHKFGCACNEMVPVEVYKKFIDKKELIGKYERWVLDSFVEGQQQIKWCTKPGCNNAVEYKAGGSKTIKCSCGHEFCFRCSEIAHSPAPCDLVRKWQRKAKTDDATEIWLKARTKECPNCQVRIEKNKACNHMNCTKCGHHFCWLCKGPWAKHGSQTGGFYVCNRYNDQAKKGVFSEEEKGVMSATKLLQKYEYYYQRYQGSVEGIKYTRELGARIEETLKDFDLNKYQFLLEAVQKLIKARSYLQWTYCMAYYLKRSGRKDLFEYQQNMLVGSTEELQDIMEKNKPEDLLDKRTEVLHKISSITNFTAKMVEQVEKGEFEKYLMSDADLSINQWCCVLCKKENKPTLKNCRGCGACQLHGEADCKSSLCKKN